jgi:indole-3-acetate monooxygenase
MIEDAAHPSIYLQEEWIRIIRDNSLYAEKLGGFHSNQLKLAYEQQWFKLFVPETYGGLEMALPDVIRLEEALSWADGSIGWTVTLCSGAGWFGGFIAPELAKEIFADPRACLGGSGAPSGTAILTENGYQVTGRWRYATGAPHTTHFTANCIIKNGNENILDEDGKPLMLSFIFNKKDVTIIDDWSTTGLIATASHSFAVNELNVSKNNCFKLTPDNAISDNCIYKYPFLQFAEATLAVNISGMAVHFIDLCESIFAARITGKNLKDYQRKVLHEGLSESKNIIQEKRSAFYNAIENSWLSICNQNEISPHNLEEVSKTSRNLAKSALQQVSELYPYCGLIAANPLSEVNRVWRDLHTASQHTLLAMPY